MFHVRSTKYKQIRLIVLSALLLSLSFHFSALSVLAWFGLVPFFFSLSACRKGKVSFWNGTLLGLLFFLLTLYWLYHVSFIGWFLLSAVLSFFFSFFSYLSHRFIRILASPSRVPSRIRLAAFFVIPSFWTLLEWLRGFLLSGFPWALLSYSQWQNLYPVQIADQIGAFGVSFMMVLANLVIFFVIKHRRLLTKPVVSRSGKRSLKILDAILICALPVALISYAFIYGVFCFQSAPPQDEASQANPRYLYDPPQGVGGSLPVRQAGVLRREYSQATSRRSPSGFVRQDSWRTAGAKAGKAPFLRVALVQGNIPQKHKWNPRFKNWIFDKYAQLSLMTRLDHPDLVIWPETSFPGYWEEEEELSEKMRRLVRNTGAEYLIGAPTASLKKSGLHFYNTALYFDRQGSEKGRYHKQHLVPFGEFVPAGFSWVRPFVEIGRFSPGRKQTIFIWQPPAGLAALDAGQKPVLFSVFICYEDVFPSLARKAVRYGASFLVNMTNDAWFGRTSAPYQHAQGSVFRAIENRRPMLRAANSGYSCFIDSYGRIEGAVSYKGREIFVDGTKTRLIYPRFDTTLYTRYGDWWVWVCALFSGFVLLMLRKRKRVRKSY